MLKKKQQTTNKCPRHNYYMLAIPALRRQRHEDLWNLMPHNLAYLIGSRLVRELIAKKKKWGGWMIPEEPP